MEIVFTTSMRYHKAMWTEIENKKQQLDAKRPLTRNNLQALNDWYDVALTYSSNAIEGNTLTHSETAIVLEKGLTVRGKPMKDHLEAIDHKEALDFVRDLASKDDPVTELDIKSIHQLVLSRSNKNEAGRYSPYERSVLGSNVSFPSPSEIAPLMEEFSNWISTSASTPQFAIEAHARLVTIHPFSDGNGRTARLLMNLILIKGGYPPALINPEDKPDYIDALESRQLTGDKTGFEPFMATRLIESLDAYIEACDKELGTGSDPSMKP